MGIATRAYRDSRATHVPRYSCKGLFSSGFVMKDEHGFGFYVE